MKGFQCDELFAFIAVDEDGNEGVVMATSEGSAVPLVTASLETVKTFVPFARHIAEQEKINIKLYHYRRQGEVAREFLDQFIGVRLTGDPGGSGEVPTGDDEEPDSGDAGDSDERGPDNQRKPH